MDNKIREHYVIHRTMPEMSYEIQHNKRQNMEVLSTVLNENGRG